MRPADAADPDHRPGSKLDTGAELDVDGLVDGFARLTRGFADLDFLDPGGRLEIARSVPEVTCIRIELPGTAALRLTSVIIDADGLDDPVAQTTRAASSAASKTDAAILQRGSLLDPADPSVGVQTRSELRPWLEISFAEPVDLRRLTLVNVTDQNAAAVRGVQVLVRTADGWWTTLYDELARERALVRTVERRYSGGLLGRRVGHAVRSRLGRDSGVGAAAGVAGAGSAAGDLVRMLTAIQLRDHAPIFKDLDRIALPPDVVSEFRRAVSDKIVARRQQEWNIHGIKRSFRFWSEQEKKEYLGFAVDVINCLRQLNSNVCFGFGSVLSVVRDHELIPHDDDLDVLIGFDPDEASTLAEGLVKIKQCLQDKGFVVTGNFTSYHWVYPPGGGGQKLDAFVGLFEGDRISWYPGKRGALTREMMFPPVHRELLGYDCAVPRQPEQYLEQVYGPGWVRPDPHFRHRWRRSEYADIAR